MKIYSNSILSVDEQIKIFEKCKEQGLWVRCEDEMSKMFGGSGIVYICPGSINKNYPRKSGETDCLVTGNYVYYDTDKLPVSGFTNDTCGFYLSNIHIHEPVTTYTTAELFGLDNDAHKKPFIRAAGKDIWVLASGPKLGWAYVKVLDANDPDRIYVDTIPEEYVYPDPDSFLEYNPYSMIEERDIPWSEIQAYMPLEILTQDEMDEALEKAEEVYENPPD